MQKFDNLIKKDKYQIFIFACPASLPISFACHPWFVLNKKGDISRWEIMHKRDKINKNFGYLHKNNRLPFKGFGVFYPFSFFFWKAKLIGLLEGDENSKIPSIIEFIENSLQNYPYCFRYSFLGPNSNTYIQWVLNKFPEFNIKLNWRFIGKNYKIKL